MCGIVVDYADTCPIVHVVVVTLTTRTHVHVVVDYANNEYADTVSALSMTVRTQCPGIRRPCRHCVSLVNDHADSVVNDYADTSFFWIFCKYLRVNKQICELFFDKKVSKIS